MSKTSLDLVRDRLAIARVCLQESVPRATPFIERLLGIDQRLSNADDRKAGADIRTIITELSELKSTGNSKETLAQDPSRELLPGVADGIVQLSKAVDLLV